jgi:protein ImuB
MTLAHARSAYAGKLAIGRADPFDDARALDRLAGWFLRFSPLVAPDHPNGLMIDATGVPHLFGGEAAMLNKIIERLQRDKISSQIAMAETPGAAWACAHYGNEGVIANGATRSALEHLPVAALRIKQPVVESLNRVGIRTIGDLLRIPRATIPHRFGRDVMQRLDQALGDKPEAINPVFPQDAKSEVMKFTDPIATREALVHAAVTLCDRLCRRLELVMQGAKRIDLMFLRVDGHSEAIRVSTAQATYDAKHIARMFVEKIETVDPGFGIEVATLTANLTELVNPKQSSVLKDADVDHRELATLADRLSNLHGSVNVFKVGPTQSAKPELAVKRYPITADVTDDWPKAHARPVHLLEQPEIIEVTAMLPDYPPKQFKWRHRIHKIKHATGPERMRDEWWRAANEIGEIRDYFKVENERGERFWIYRDNRLTQNSTYRWYMHGFFA